MVREATHIHNWPGSRNWIEVKAAPAPGIVSRCFMSHCQNAQAPGMQTKNGQTVAALRKEVPWCLGVIRKWDRWATLSINGNTKTPSNGVSKNLSQVPLDVIQWLFHTPKTSWKTFTKLGPLCWCRVAYVRCFLFTWTNVWIVRTPCSLRLAQILMHHYQILPAIFGADELHEWRNLSRQKICTMCPKIPKMVYSPTNKAIPLWN